MLKVYLAGKIYGASYKEATSWRNYLKDKLKHKYEFLDPMEGKENLSALKTNIPIQTNSNPLEVFQSNIIKINECDIFLINLQHLPVFASAIELGYAYKLGEEKPLWILGICNNEYAEHPFTYGTLDYIFNDIKEVSEWLDNLKIETYSDSDKDY